MKFHFRQRLTTAENEWMFRVFRCCMRTQTKESRHEPEAIGRFLSVFCLFLIHQWIAWMGIWIWIVKLVYAAYGRKNFYVLRFTLRIFSLVLFIFSYFSIIIILFLPLSVNTLVLFFIYSFRPIARVAWLPADDQREQSSRVFVDSIWLTVPCIIW